MNDYTKRIIRGGEYTPDDCKYPMLWVQMHKILAFHLCEFCSAETYEDFAHNTDAILSLPKKSYRIACRIRDAKYYNIPKFRTQFTIRSRRPGNAPTELQKILSGWGDVFFYGFANHHYTRFLGFFILDLHELRKHLPCIQPVEVIVNDDASSIFSVYALIQFPREVIIAASRGVWEALEEERAVKERYARHVRASFDVLRTYRQQQGC